MMIDIGDDDDDGYDNGLMIMMFDIGYDDDDERDCSD